MATTNYIKKYVSDNIAAQIAKLDAAAELAAIKAKFDCEDIEVAEYNRLTVAYHNAKYRYDIAEYEAAVAEKAYENALLALTSPRQAECEARDAEFEHFLLMTQEGLQ